METARDIIAIIRDILLITFMVTIMVVGVRFLAAVSEYRKEQARVTQELTRPAPVKATCPPDSTDWVCIYGK